MANARAAPPVDVRPPRCEQVDQACLDLPARSERVLLGDVTIQGTQLREAESGFRYTPTSTFDTFPFPWSPAKETADDPRIEAIAAAAHDLVAQRDRWLNPEGATGQDLRERTLTNLYHARPTWLDVAHRRLDDAVLDAYGWPRDLDNHQILERLLSLNQERAAHSIAPQRSAQPPLLRDNPS